MLERFSYLYGAYESPVFGKYKHCYFSLLDFFSNWGAIIQTGGGAPFVVPSLRDGCELNPYITRLITDNDYYWDFYDFWFWWSNLHDFQLTEISAVNFLVDTYWQDFHSVLGTPVFNDCNHYKPSDSYFLLLNEVEGVKTDLKQKIHMFTKVINLGVTENDGLVVTKYYPRKLGSNYCFASKLDNHTFLWYRGFFYLLVLLTFYTYLKLSSFLAPIWLTKLFS